MTNFKLFTLFIAIIIISVAINIYYDSFMSDTITDINAVDWSNDVSLIAYKASEYWRTPSVMGGGSDSFLELDSVALLGLHTTVLNAVYEITDIKETEFTLVSKEIIPGAIVETTITFQGIATLPIIIEI